MNDSAVLILIAATRFLLPLAIPRYPLAAILAALLLDGVDQSVFQQFAPAALEGYQGYDKALDIYYLTIAYVSTLRNWENRFALRLSRVLFYWRLVGVTVFEITQLRWILLVFPNTFEYFFIFCEAATLRWRPERFSRRLLLGAAAAIWILIKLPQEYWLHIAQVDTTDWIKTEVLGHAGSTSWLEILAQRPWIVPALIVTLGLVGLAAWWFVAPRLPPAERHHSLGQEADSPRFSREEEQRAVDEEMSEIVDEALVEKVVLITLVSVSFAHVLPGLGVTDLQLASRLALVVVANTALAHWFARRGHTWALSLRQFAVLGAVNIALALLQVALRRDLQNAPGLAAALFFALLLTLLVTLYDHYRHVYLMRFREEG